jgi:cell division protein FtsB
MPKVIKGNRQLTVAEEKVNEFLTLGWSLINDKGDIIEVGQATDLKSIKAENDTLKAELAKLKAENDKLKKENAKLKKAE